MSNDTTSTKTCQVDFYLLEESSAEAGIIACRLALMSWERKQNVFVITTSQTATKQLDKLMWQYPEGRFLPHSGADDENAAKAPVNIGTISSLIPTDVVINLCPEAVPQPGRFSRVLEIVPFAESEKALSRVKYKTYLKLGLKPGTHEINK